MLRYLVSVLATVSWSLWFGGQVALFLFVTTLLKTFDDRREIFGEAGSAAFNMFNRYQLIIGAIALVTAFILRLTGASGMRSALFIALAVAAVGAVVISTSITPRIDRMRVAGQTQTPQFKKLHGQSMMVYSAETLALLVAGTLLPGALKMPPE